MPATLLDSNVFKDIFTTAEMRNVFSDEFRVSCYLEIEAALAKVQGRMGIIPREATDEIMAAIGAITGQEPAGVYNERPPEA